MDGIFKYFIDFKLETPKKKTTTTIIAEHWNLEGERERERERERSNSGFIPNDLP